MPRGRCLPLSIGFGAVVILAIGLGVGLGVGLNSDHHSQKSSSHDNANAKAAASSSASASAAAASASATPVKTFARWDWTKDKAYGVALGNHLLLERWMDEDWFVNASSANTWDEWSFSQNAPNASQTLEDHWKSWITEDDIKTIAAAGMNSVRIPIGFWALIPTETGEPYIHGSQLQIIDNMLPWLAENNLYALLEIHGMPGSQNGAQTSGHNTSDIEFYTDAQQTRADATVAAALSYITNSTYSFLFMGLGVVNEPVTYTDDQLSTLAGFYNRSWAQTSAANVSMIFHHAYKGIAYWRDFVTGKDPRLLVIEDHAYPGTFPPSSDANDIVNQVCSNAKSYTGYPVPVLSSEWTLMTGLTSNDFFAKFWRVQAAAYNWSGGSFFWSLRAKQSQHPVLSNGTNWVASSMEDLLKLDGVVPTPSSGQDVQAFLTGLDSTCGSVPSQSWASSTGSNAKLRRARNI